MAKQQHHKRLKDFAAFDKITLEVVPRYKESGLSGDTWRTSVRVVLFFKGQPVHELGFRNMQFALMLLPHDWNDAQEPITERHLALETTACSQPGCDAPWAVVLRLKKLYSDDGDLLDANDRPANHFRRFCSEHKKRGNASREDCDDNYELVAVNEGG